MSGKDTPNHANQCNPNNELYQGYTSQYTGTGTKADLDNHANQSNPNNPVYESSRGSGSGNSDNTSGKGSSGGDKGGNNK